MDAPAFSGAPLAASAGFAAWKQAFFSAATAHGCHRYYMEPAFDDPLALDATLSQLAAADAALALQGRPALDPAQRLARFNELHALHRERLAARARLFLESAVAAPLQASLASYPTAFAAYERLQQCFEPDATHEALAALLAATRADAAEVEGLVSALAAAARQGLDLAHLSAAEYDRRLWTRLGAAFVARAQPREAALEDLSSSEEEDEALPMDETPRGRSVYITRLNHTVTEADLEAHCGRFGLETDPATGFPAIDVFLNHRTRRPRGDAVARFETARGAGLAAAALDGLRAVETAPALAARLLDAATDALLQAQIYAPKSLWTCTGCRHRVSCWRDACDVCGVDRVWPAERAALLATDWLCRLCV
ncbi:hypothetical protein ACHHYP_09236 [Achlya hypogyna]|uniref:RRM domain-containing protein n=1 Tax=Achlya hypogyna TaxID=1202772 RepID=A0A1V9YNK7_ACHHY|nr:hypothetical protein ACHHYP_09236 [Achlya hypogyna]